MAATLSVSEWTKAIQAKPLEEAEVGGVAKALKALKAHGYGDPKGKASVVLDDLDDLIKAAESVRGIKVPKAAEMLRMLVKEAKAARAEVVKAEADRKKAEAEQEDEGDDEVSDDLLAMLKRAKALTFEKALSFVCAPGRPLSGLVVGRRIGSGHKERAKKLRTQNNDGKETAAPLILGRVYGKEREDEPEDLGDGKLIVGRLVFHLLKDPRGGLAKNLKQTILKQAGKTFRLKVRGPSKDLDAETDSGDLEDEAPDAGSGVGDATPAEDRGPDRDAFDGLLATIPGDVQRLRRSNPRAADLATAVVEKARRYGEAGDYRKGAALLATAAEAVAAANASARAGEGATAAAAASVDVRNVWRRVSGDAVDGVLKVTAALRRYGDDELDAAADVLASLSDAFPDGLDEALDAYAEAAGSGDRAARIRARTAVRERARACLDYLNANARVIAECEANPFGLDVEVAASLRQALRQTLLRVG